MRRIDAFTHIWPEPFYRRLSEMLGTMSDITRRSEAVPMMIDLETRLRIMDAFPGYEQILSLGSPPLDLVATPQQAVDLSRIGSEGMAELCMRHPHRFPAFIASPPMNAEPELLVAETRAAIEDFGACGVQVYTNVGGVPLDHPDFLPFWDYMAEAGRPVWLHPARGAGMTDYASEKKSKYEIWWTFGWPYESSAAMARLVFSGLFDRHPDLKIVTHHGGAMIPFFEGRVGYGWDVLGARTSDEDYAAVLRGLKRRPLDYFRLYYADTALFGSEGGTRCAIDFFGADHVVFATDAPFDPEGGSLFIRETIRLLDGMELSDADRASIYYGNIGRLTGMDFS